MCSSTNLSRALKNLILKASSMPGFNRHLKNVKVLSADVGKAVFQFQVDKTHINIYGSLHGGMIATLVDGLTATTVSTVLKPNKSAVSVDMFLTYARSSEVGDILTIKSEVVKNGQVMAFLKADIYNQNEKLIASGNHSFYVGGSNL